MLTPDELQHGYWGAKRLAGQLPDRSITHPHELTDSDVLSLWCMQTNLSASDQRKLIKTWCQLLPTLSVKTLLFTSKVNQELFDAAAQIKGLDALYIKWSSIKSIEAIVDCKALTALEIGSSPSLTGLSSLAQLPRLRNLRIENVKEAHDLGFASALTELEEFGVCGSMWTDQKIDDLSALQGMQKLELLWLIGATVKRGGLMPLHSLPRLTHLKTALNFRASEFQAIREAMTSLKYGTPFEHDLIAQYCKP